METNLPEDCLECHFHLVTGDHFTVDYDMVEVDYIDVGGKHRQNEQKRWQIKDGDLERELIEEEVLTVMVTVKDECRDTIDVPELPDDISGSDE